MSKHVVAVDFDGTIVEHRYPLIGNPVPSAIETLVELEQDGWQLILWTMRSGKPLEEAVAYCAGQGVKFWGVNENPDQKASGWSTSPKAYAPIYIDDAALGCPLIVPTTGDRPFVDWLAVRKHLGLRND